MVRLWGGRVWLPVGEDAARSSDALAAIGLLAQVPGAGDAVRHRGPRIGGAHLWCPCRLDRGRRQSRATVWKL